MSNLTALCAINSTIDPSCDCIASGGGPQMNPDISGPGVRISFYLQALFLAFLSARSGSVEEMTGSLYTLITTNVAMAVTALILGFKAEPEISLHDAIVVLYLLTLSWASLFFSMPLYNCLSGSRKTLKFVYILHSYVLFAFAFAILSTAGHFGKTAPCNPHAVFVIFRPFRAIHTGIIVAWVVLPVVFLGYSVITINDYKPEILEWSGKIREAQKRREGGTVTAPMPSQTMQTNNPTDNIQGGRQTPNNPGISDILIVELIVIIITWALIVTNTELVITRNNFSGGDGTGPDSWQFAQILPMFLVVLPLVNVIKAFYKYKLNQCEQHVHRRHVRIRMNGHTSSNGSRPGDQPLRAPHTDSDLQTVHISEQPNRSVHSESSVHPIDSL